MQTNVSFFALIADFLENQYGFLVSLSCALGVPLHALRIRRTIESRGLPSSAPQLMANLQSALIHLFGFAMLSPGQKNIAKSKLRQRHSILISNLAVRRQGRSKVLVCALQVSEVEEDIPKIIVFVA